MNWIALTIKTKKNLALSKIIPIFSNIPARNNNKTIITFKYPTININYKTVALTITTTITSILTALKIITITNQINLNVISLKRHRF